MAEDDQQNMVVAPLFFLFVIRKHIFFSLFNKFIHTSHFPPVARVEEALPSGVSEEERGRKNGGPRSRDQG